MTKHTSQAKFRARASLKLILGTEIRRVAVSPDSLSFKSLEDITLSVFPYLSTRLPFDFLWVDDESDEITLSSDRELEECLYFMASTNKQLLRFKVSTKSQRRQKGQSFHYKDHKSIEEKMLNRSDQSFVPAKCVQKSPSMMHAISKLEEVYPSRALALFWKELKEEKLNRGDQSFAPAKCVQKSPSMMHAISKLENAFASPTRKTRLLTNMEKSLAQGAAAKATHRAPSIQAAVKKLENDLVQSHSAAIHGDQKVVYRNKGPVASSFLTTSESAVNLYERRYTAGGVKWVISHVNDPSRQTLTNSSTINDTDKERFKNEDITNWASELRVLADMGFNDVERAFPLLKRHLSVSNLVGSARTQRFEQGMQLVVMELLGLNLT